MSKYQHLTQFLSLYHQLDKTNLSMLKDVYDKNVVFEDPLHTVEGLDSLTGYFANMYENLNSGKFEIHTCFEQADKASVYWTMRFSHKKIKQGKTLEVNGNTYLEYKDGKVVYHRDFFDAGQMIYQHLPLFGSLIGVIKRRTAA